MASSRTRLEARYESIEVKWTKKKKMVACQSQKNRMRDGEKQSGVRHQGLVLKNWLPIGCAYFTNLSPKNSLTKLTLHKPGFLHKAVLQCPDNETIICRRTLNHACF